MITITENAVKEIEQGLTETQEPYLRISIEGGGCSGFKYTFDFDQTKAEDDFETNRVLIDSFSMQYLMNSTLDWVEDAAGAEFVILNPNAKSTCGCKSSFTV